MYILASITKISREGFSFFNPIPEVAILFRHLAIFKHLIHSSWVESLNQQLFIDNLVDS